MILVLGAFLIPFVLMMTLVGIPCFMLELALGQYGRGGPFTAWSKVSPLFKGKAVDCGTQCMHTSITAGMFFVYLVYMYMC